MRRYFESLRPADRSAVDGRVGSDGQKARGLMFALTPSSRVSQRMMNDSAAGSREKRLRSHLRARPYRAICTFYARL